MQTQAYYAGLEGGQFDGFLASLPQVDSIEAAGWPIRHNAPEDAITPQNGPERPTAGAITVWSTTDQSDYTPEQEAHIRALYAELGSLRAVQRELYQQEGGYWFYRIRQVIEGR
ncbi:MAG: hypothetical protein V9H69_24085 [Anaerolineae bacterium]